MDFDSVAKAGSRLGTGTLIVLDDKTCPVGMVLILERFFARESCGWCTPCREGLPWIVPHPRGAGGRRGEMGDIEILEEPRGSSPPGAPSAPSPPAPWSRWGALSNCSAKTSRRTCAGRAAHGNEARSTIYVDGEPRAVELAEGRNLLQACLSLGYDLPYFCWHPAMHRSGPAGSARSSNSGTSDDKRGRIVMSCMTPVGRRHAHLHRRRGGEASSAQGVIEWLMINHPHDCPICDEGGECHLQDMTVMTGHDYRRYRFTKRTHENQDLGPFMNHEMNRCIQCYRCVRFYRDYAGGRDFDRPGLARRCLFRPSRGRSARKRIQRQPL